MSVIPPYETNREYHQRLSETLSMPIIRWKALKGVFYAVLMAAVSVAMSALPHGSWMQLLVFAATLLIIFGVEFEEVEIANIVSVTFTGPDDTDNEDQNDGSQ